ncbi:hypothetical protein [Corynebacterium mustelae]|uniref:hypothetical protein n=1 Tax=Corynebacterium mustelae TaxID=571915 RepID=UPI000640FE06|nr:hypothetical protein [Corynebacterium mustelae]
MFRPLVEALPLFDAATAATPHRRSAATTGYCKNTTSSITKQSERSFRFCRKQKACAVQSIKNGAIIPEG